MKPTTLWSAALCVAASVAFGDDANSVRIHGQAWLDVGRIVNSTDTITYNTVSGNVLNLNGNGIQSSGAQFTAVSEFGNNFEGALGFGVQKVNHAIGQGTRSFLTISLYQEYITESRLTYYLGEKSNPALSVTLGTFAYNYNPDVKNLGLYLLRGPVYPGVLMGGFQDFAVDSTKGTMLGLHIHQATGNFSEDLILNNEREIPPTLDWSLAYVAKYKAFDALEIGAGVNFYRLIPYDSKLETPGHLSDAALGFQKQAYVEVDPATNDTTFFSNQGTKVMGMMSLDLKRLFGIQSSNPDDMKLYGEAALLGTKNYGKTYGDRMKRIPVMAGFNIPTFGLLDHVSLEVEYYSALYRNDLFHVGNNNVVADWTLQPRPIPSPKPVTNADYGIDSLGNWVNALGDTVNVKGTAMDMEHMTQDNLKWSLFVDKTFAHHVMFMGQVANDHYRPRSVATGLIKAEGGTAEAFSTLKDWYFMVRMGYFF